MYANVPYIKIIPIQKTIPDCFIESAGIEKIHSNTIPSANVGETDTDYIITIAAPGLFRESFQIEIENSIINISALKEKIKTKYKIDRFEYNYSKWTRAFQLPVDADSMRAQAKYINGELIIHIPRSESNENMVKAFIYVY
ncbi:MAG: Hsp20/alpha crystallin family protein [Chitinophagaceae bacterium]